MKKLSKILVCFLFLSTLFLSACTVNLGALIAPRYNEYDWFCEEIQITCLNQQFDGAGYAVMDYKTQAYTTEYYHETDARFNVANSDDCEKIYPVIQAFIDYDGNFYVKYSEHTVVFDEEYNDYSWVSTFSQDLLVGDVKSYGSYFLVEVNLDNLYNGEYVGKTIRFERI